MNPLHLIERAIEREPRLTAFGVGIHFSKTDAIEEFNCSRNRLLSRTGMLEVVHCAQWLCDGRGTGERNSYGLKHEVENHYDRYVANGSLIAAALGMGFEYRVEGANVVVDLGRTQASS